MFLSRPLPVCLLIYHVHKKSKRMTHSRTEHETLLAIASTVSTRAARIRYLREPYITVLNSYKLPNNFLCKVCTSIRHSDRHRVMLLLIYNTKVQPKHSCEGHHATSLKTGSHLTTKTSVAAASRRWHGSCSAGKTLYTHRWCLQSQCQDCAHIEGKHTGKERDLHAVKNDREISARSRFFSSVEPYCCHWRHRSEPIGVATNLYQLPASRAPYG